MYRVVEKIGGLFNFKISKELKFIKGMFFRYFAERARICDAPPLRRGLGTAVYLLMCDVSFRSLII